MDVTDATFQTEVIERSKEVPVVVDLWAAWCGPCRTLGPILERVVAATEGKAVLVKVDVDANPQVAQAFQVQSIPAVYALRDGQVVDGFIGAQPEDKVQAFVDALLPTEEQSVVAQLIAAGDEQSLREALELDPPNEQAILKLAELLVQEGTTEEALALLNRVPDSAEARRIGAMARTADSLDGIDVEARLLVLLDAVKEDDEAKQEYLDLLELLGSDDPRTPEYRKQLSSRLY
ncbi:MAG: thioredoxin [Actinobacteria bacterium]|nr:thioredoxin [Actinomycetota bacterium]